MLPNENIRIYGGANQPAMGEGERSAALYLQHQENGNLAKCRELGKLLGVTFAGDTKRFEGDPFAVQKLVLLSFVLSDELAGIVFDQMLQKSAWSVFLQTVETLDRALSDAISDSTAYTLYMLDDRYSNDFCLGGTFAELCKKGGDPQLTAEGNALETEYRKLCADIISSYSFAAVG